MFGGCCPRRRRSKVPSLSRVCLLGFGPCRGPKRGVQMTQTKFIGKRKGKVLSTVYTGAMKCTHEKMLRAGARAVRLTAYTFSPSSPSPMWRSPSRVGDFSLTMHDEYQSCHPCHQFEEDYDHHQFCQDSLGCTSAPGLPRVSECAS